MKSIMKFIMNSIMKTSWNHHEFHHFCGWKHMNFPFFVGENTVFGDWPAFVGHRVFVTELPPQILHEPGRDKKWRAESFTGAQVASEFYVLLEGSGGHPGVLQWLVYGLLVYNHIYRHIYSYIGYDRHICSYMGVSSVGSWKKYPENEIFCPANMIRINSFLELAVSKIWHEKWGPFRISEKWTATSIGLPTNRSFPGKRSTFFSVDVLPMVWGLHISVDNKPVGEYHAVRDLMDILRLRRRKQKRVCNDSNLWWRKCLSVKVLDISQCLGTQLFSNDSRDDVSSFTLTRGTCEWMMFLCGKLWKNILWDRLFQWVHWACST